MKKVIISVLLLAAVGFGIYYFVAGRNDSKNNPDPSPLAIDKNTGEFNQSYQKLLHGYYGLKDALVASDSGKANAAAVQLAGFSDSLKIDEIKGDSTGAIKETAKSFTTEMSNSARNLLKENSLDGKRRQFETISEILYNLTRTVRYDGEKIYYQYCPMAFNNKGAYWLSNQYAVRNPYFGDEMLECGSVEDSLDYGTK